MIVKTKKDKLIFGAGIACYLLAGSFLIPSSQAGQSLQANLAGELEKSANTSVKNGGAAISSIVNDAKEKSGKTLSSMMPSGKTKLPELKVPSAGKCGIDFVTPLLPKIPGIAGDLMDINILLPQLPFKKPSLPSSILPSAAIGDLLPPTLKCFGSVSGITDKINDAKDAALNKATSGIKGELNNVTNTLNGATQKAQGAVNSVNNTTQKINNK
jgi:hypothetical protein